MATQKTQDGSIQVLLYNGQSPGQGYKNDTYYTVAAAQDIGVTVTGLDPNVAYNVTLQRVDETHGNAWGAWNTLGRPTMANMDATAWQTVRDAMASPPESLGAALCGATFLRPRHEVSRASRSS
jgi:beta-xylosidase